MPKLAVGQDARNLCYYLSVTALYPHLPGLPRRASHRTVPSQAACGINVVNGTKGFHADPTWRKIRQQPPPNTANPQGTSVTAAAGIPDLCAT